MQPRRRPPNDYSASRNRATAGLDEHCRQLQPGRLAAVASREVLGASPGWGTVTGCGALLAAAAISTSGLATWAFRSYQRNV